MEAHNSLLIVKQSDPSLTDVLLKALQNGFPLLIENIGEEISPLLGVTLINFLITKMGLENQLLGLVVSHERPELEERKNSLLMESAQNRKSLQRTQEKILEVLSTAGQNLLEDEKAIEIMSSSRVCLHKQLSQEITAKEQIVKETEKEIDKARSGYNPVATHASVLFFCVLNLASLEVFYQYSLTWFLNLYYQAIKMSGYSEDISSRIDSIRLYLTKSVFNSVSQSLFEKHKLLLPFMLAIRMQQSRAFFLWGGWVGDSFKQFLQLIKTLLYSLSGLDKAISSNTSKWKTFFDSSHPELETLPEPFSNLKNLEILAVLKCLRPDRIKTSVQNIIRSELGEEFLVPPPFDLKSTFETTTRSTPVVFILTPGSDPITPLLRFSETLGLDQENIEVVSLGQGQEGHAESTLRQGAEEGSWVILQNCHLAQSWLPRLEVICDEVLKAPSTKPEFRLWFSSYPCTAFPISLLQDAIKITNEAPGGLRANLLKSYQSDPISNEDFFTSVETSSGFQRLIFGLCFFHALVQERKAFGPLGWNVPYEFNEADLRISLKQLQMLLTENTEAAPLEALTYLTGECNYGGRVTDDQDRRLLMCLLHSFCNQDIINKPGKFKVFGIGDFGIPQSNLVDEHIHHLKTLPMEAPPSVFGLHDNATLAKDNRETDKLLNSILALEPRLNITNRSESSSEVVLDLALEILARLPSLFDLSEVERKHPLSYAQSLNTVLRQEILRYNRLTSCIRSTLKEVHKAVRGEAILSEELEGIYKALLRSGGFQMLGWRGLTQAKRDWHLI
ncbi:Dynein heavy chain 3, axonemal [Armadillidium vulgare]|nr:Dynein heavy chain 3, axonemal [Armadillidium vulgare]